MLGAQTAGAAGGRRSTTEPSRAATVPAMLQRPPPADRSRASTRRCARPLCGAEASATLTYDYGNASVRIDPASSTGHPMDHDLCAEHADRLVVPRGWELEDRRQPPEPIFRVKRLVSAGAGAV